MNPEKRNIIDKGIEMIKNDTTGGKKKESGKAAEIAESYVAQEILDTEKELAAKYDDAVKEVMMLTGKSTDTEIGKRFYETLMADKEKYIAAAIQKVLGDKSKTLVDAENELLELFKSASIN